ncbi:PRC-barrel domain-containing protein [Aromatoleum aromaticum]|uniref:PRC-barrel domain-containing protein n=1 Tax=Aromatoleum aromaticum (strain DSM 19018 / LMG 30748 / EbN1) TaxID=76114 RepID=Q5NXV4_AROAE|nr:PRC-barrel domain-containing protein [Aromatoleum aromaticum]NMG54473.1 hypothetical protein [Aromatoleum aromaticum]CAI10110.1 hypothetical protein ebA7011 [Aromatoleum aromaticum EbN1]
MNMNARTKRKLIAALAATAVGLPAYMGHAAEERPAPPATSTREAPPAAAPDAATAAQSRVARASKLIGAEVKNPVGEKLGEIKDLVVDVRNQTAHYAVLSFGGIAGIADKLFAYPVSMLRWGPGKDELILDIQRSRLEAAPGFGPGNWPDWGVDSYRRSVDEYFKTDRPTALGPNPQLMQASKLLDVKVEDREKRNAGEIKDLVVSLADGTVPYAVLDLDKAWSADDKLIPLPLSSFEFSTDDEKVMLKESREGFDTSRGFDEKHWPDMNDPALRRDMNKSPGEREQDRK